MHTTTLATWLISADTAAEIDFLRAVLGAHETPAARVADGDRIMHAEVVLDGASLLLFDAGPLWPPTPAHLRVYVKDVARTLDEAVAHGGTVISAATPTPFGDVAGRFRDPQGHRWWVHQHVEDISTDELAARFAEPRHRAAMSYLAESLDAEMSGAARS
jgi:PhnB protein